MTANIWIRLQHGNAYIVVSPTEGELFDIEITDVAGRPVSLEEQDGAIEQLQIAASVIRTQAYEMRGRRKPGE